MRYILKDGYIEEIAFGVASIECGGQICSEYTGTIPIGYTSLQAWAIGERGKINAWKVVDGNLVFDNAKYNELLEIWQKEETDNKPLYHKDIYEMQQQIEDIKDISESQYQKATATGQVITIDNVKKVYPRVKLTNIDPYSFSKVDLITTGKNMLINEAISQTINGIAFIQNKDRSITINGTATEAIEYNIGGSSLNTKPLLCFKKGLNYYLSGLENITLKMYYYDRTSRTEVYSGTGGAITFENEDKLVTQIVLSIPTDTTINNVTIYPQLEYGTAATNYEEPNNSVLTIDFSNCIVEGLFPSDTLFPSDELYPVGTTIDYILIEKGNISALINDKVFKISDGNVNIFDGYNTIYTLQNTNVEIEYSINVLEVDNLDYMLGKETSNKKFKVLEDASIQVNNIYQYEGAKILGGDGLLTNLFFSSSGQLASYQKLGFGTNGYDTSGGSIVIYKDTILDIYIPDNFKIVSAIPIIKHSTAQWTTYNGPNTAGYAKNIKLYKYQDGKSYTVDCSNVEEIVNQSDIDVIPAFGNSGWTPSKQAIGQVDTINGTDIATYLKNGHNILLLQTSDDIPSGDSDRIQKDTGLAILQLNIIGYMNIANQEGGDTNGL
ncbi:MAG: hypothetical protein J6D28_04620 [Bacilli bacterium]|nr:hypothetical protein [Bacilli bacterium]